jgi:hypothetical protein
MNGPEKPLAVAAVQHRGLTREFPELSIVGLTTRTFAMRLNLCLGVNADIQWARATGLLLFRRHGKHSEFIVDFHY